MAISYTVSKAATTITLLYRAIGPSAGIYTFNQRRIYLPFDLLATGLSVGQIASADLIFTVGTTTGGGCLANLHSANNANGFGATLDASNPDWASTQQNLEGQVLVNATGTYTVPVAVANLDFSGTMYYRLMNSDEGLTSPYSKGFVINSTTAASNKPILRLTLFSGQLIYVKVSYA